MSPEFEIAYRFLISEARGYDTSVENKQNSDESDISYEEDMFSLVINKSIIIFEREIKISLKGNYYYRIYTSQKAYWIDPLHLGRVDELYDLSGSARNFIGKKIWLELGVNYKDRNSKSEYNPEIPELRNYKKLYTWAKIGWVF